VTTNHSYKSLGSRRCALTAAPFLIGVLAVYNWVISPHIGYLHAMRRLEPVVDRMAEELDAVSGGFDEKCSTMRKLRGELAEVREGLFTREESKAFIRDLQTLVGKAGCTMVAADFTCGKKAKETEDPNVPVVVEALYANFTMMGQYEQIVAFLQMLREGQQKVWVDSCRIDLRDPRSGRLECRLGLAIYIVRQPGGLHP